MNLPVDVGVKNYAYCLLSTLKINIYQIVTLKNRKRKISMKPILRKLFSPLLRYFEAGEGTYGYKKSHRVVLIVAGCLFLCLASAIIAAGAIFSRMGAVFPSLIFFCVGTTCLAVGSLGTDRAVAKIWGSE
ncbi:MAG: hypothetical protein JKX92_11115 [Porticoccaceae bacterium]|nr:hypothetical protein [Porticoccaceae bacterium]